MLKDEALGKVTSELKKKLDITWEDEDTNSKLKRIIDDAEIKLNFMLGAEMDYSAPGIHRSLFLNYCMYDYNNSANEFYAAYRQDIELVQMQNEVKNAKEKQLQ